MSVEEVSISVVPVSRKVLERLLLFVLFPRNGHFLFVQLTHTAMKKKKEDLVWHTERRKVDALVGHPKNPRKISDDQLASLKKSIKRFNLVELPACGIDGRVLAGHQRLKVLQLLGRGEEEIEVRIPNRPLTKSECDAYLLTSNAVHGSWDYDLLRSFDTDFLLDIGFDTEDLARIWDDLLDVEDDAFDEDAEVAKITTPTVKQGELYALGPHRLLCADSCDPASVKKLVGTTKIDVIDFDPPFNIRLDYDKGIGGKKRYGGTVDDNKTDAEYRAFLKALIGNALAVAKKDAHAFVWCDQNYIGLVQSLYDEFGITKKRVCQWVKPSLNPTPGVAFNKSTESCVYGIVGKPFISPRFLNLNEIANKEVGSGTRTVSDIIDLFELWLVAREAGSSYAHPTQKPPTLYQKALLRSSRVGDAVLDLTAGSGALMVACDALKRRAFLSEASPVFATLIKNRYEKLTGQKAKRIA